MEQLPELITFTGFDDRTSIADMKVISEHYPVEWGVLAAPANRDARFPSTQAINEVLESGLRLSLHCCGGFAKHVRDGNFGILPYDISKFTRVQLNGEIKRPLLEELPALLLPQIIVQQRTDFTIVPEGIFELFDASGGLGVVPESIPSHPGCMVGYAGGITPENVRDFLERIKVCEGDRYWIDMETGVRTNGWFDMEKVWDVCMSVFGEPGPGYEK